MAANARGAAELARMVAEYGLPVVTAYMQHVQDNAEEAVRRVVDRLGDGSFRQEMDDGSVIAVRVTVDRPTRGATIDFTGTSPQRPDNFNAPAAVCTAAVLYVFRTLVDADIPLNAGCLKPLRLVVPTGSMLDPVFPAAVAAGNVETSQAITSALFGALGVVAASQGTMNNLTFGNERYQYYETICGGAGAGPTLGRLQRRAHAHDQLAAHRPGGAGVALPRARGRVRRAARQRRRGRAPRRRRRRATPPVPGAAHRGDRLEQPPGGALRARRRPPRRAAAATPSRAPTAAWRNCPA